MEKRGCRMARIVVICGSRSWQAQIQRIHCHVLDRSWSHNGMKMVNLGIYDDALEIYVVRMAVDW